MRSIVQWWMNEVCLEIRYFPHCKCLNKLRIDSYWPQLHYAGFQIYYVDILGKTKVFILMSNLNKG